jgi:hypothetical protein
VELPEGENLLFFATIHMKLLDALQAAKPASLESHAGVLFFQGRTAQKAELRIAALDQDIVTSTQLSNKVKTALWSYVTCCVRTSHLRRRN